MFLKLPVAGSLLQAAIVERVCRVLASLVTAGVDLPRAMAVTAEASNNAVYTEGLNHIREEMMEGNGLAAPLAETGLFPAAARQMFRVGEETGTLDKQLSTAAAFYHRELEIKVKHFTSLFEPAIIIFMGLIVGFVAVALVSAMYGIYQPSQHHLTADLLGRVRDVLIRSLERLLHLAERKHAKIAKDPPSWSRSIECASMWAWSSSIRSATITDQFTRSHSTYLLEKSSDAGLSWAFARNGILAKQRVRPGSSSTA